MTGKTIAVNGIIRQEWVDETHTYNEYLGEPLVVTFTRAYNQAEIDEGNARIRMGARQQNKSQVEQAISDGIEAMLAMQSQMMALYTGLIPAQVDTPTEIAEAFKKSLLFQYQANQAVIGLARIVVDQFDSADLG